MTTWGVTLRTAIVAAALLGACSDDGDNGAATTSTDRASTSTAPTTTSTPPERPASTTTTAYDPSAVEGQVEAAYLKSWDVYADAVYDLELDEAALAEVFAEEHLETKRSEISSRIEDRRAAHVLIEHDYSVQLVDEGTAVIIDEYVNHQVLIDPETKEPIEADPNEVVADAITLKFLAGGWKVAFKERLE